jgi:hypothetical protein
MGSQTATVILTVFKPNQCRWKVILDSIHWLRDDTLLQALLSLLEILLDCFAATFVGL